MAGNNTNTPASESRNNTPGTVQEMLYKVLVIGEFGVGKTSIIRRYTEGYFSPNYKLTIGVDFALKSLDWDERTKINLQLWDIAGHERFGHMTRVYYKYAIAAIIVFDLSRPTTFESVLKWYIDVNEKVMLADQQPIPVILLANKCDIDDSTFDKSSLEDFCKQHKFIGWFETSAKLDKNIDEAMQFLVSHILKLSSEGQKRDESAISLEDDPLEDDEEEVQPQEERKPSGCCS
ncbi:PREDICTED: ras-related protein Rab-32B-like [Branchiostoma belcheri]|uniref:Ras-related protein Rab n=1 Tax=Branchiostoma belcheri TaxID=7741 RepID=A0A6P5AJW8_BRABE|nr:PREDICTED: ras-related protein Rab-32B-like [Branchiostoma belcheri]